MTTLSEFDAIVRHAWTEPKFVARMQWHQDYGLAFQLARLGDQLIDQAGADTVTLAFHEMPDFDWWEPRYDQPWRRQAARDRGESA